MERQYTIYRITSPSGRMYTGYTSMPLAERWRHHKRRAAAGEAGNHPFYCEIREYGCENFSVEAIDSVNGLLPTLRREKERIAECPPALRLNLSPGGLDDARFGARQFWDRMNQNPSEKAAYLKKLSDAKKAADWSDYAALAQKSLAWRAMNPRQAYKQSHRAIRIASRNKAPGMPVLPETQEERKRRLMWKYKRSEMCRQTMTRVWQNRSSDDKAMIGTKISITHKRRMAGISDPEKRSAMTAKAREAIDRDHQGKCASNGLKRFWEDLRKDPARYRAYIEKRSESVSATLKRKYADMNEAERRKITEKAREQRRLKHCEPTT